MKQKMKSIIEFWRKYWGLIMIFIISSSIIALFIASFVTGKQLTLSVMNEWVSLVVGMAALILGIISLFLSFYNVEQSNEVQKDTIKMMTELQKDVTAQVYNLKSEMNSRFDEVKNGPYRGIIADKNQKEETIEGTQGWIEDDE
ncbi:MAG: hypothetical protein PHW34_13420 [Hespellia sp.]|nr:hypothetical protein [Hespellia sp.]